MPQVDPTPQEVMSQLNMSGGRAVPAVDETLDILSRLLPAQIAYVNANLRGVENELVKLPPIGDFGVAGSVLSGVFPEIIVAHETDTESLAPRTFADHINLMVFVAYDRWEDRRNWADASDLAYLVRGIMCCYTRGHSDARGRRVWTQLVPAGITTIPPRWTDYKGYAAHFQVYQAPFNDLWAL